METHKRINVEQIETSKNSNEIKNNPIQWLFKIRGLVLGLIRLWS